MEAMSVVKKWEMCLYALQAVYGDHQMSSSTRRRVRGFLTEDARALSYEALGQFVSSSVFCLLDNNSLRKVPHVLLAEIGRLDMLTCKFDNYMGELLKILIITWVSKRAAENSQQSSVRQSITFPRNFHVYLCISMPVLPPTYLSKFRSRSSKIYNLFLFQKFHVTCAISDV
jgi:hypothetical protein